MDSEVDRPFASLTALIPFFVLIVGIILGLLLDGLLSAEASGESDIGLDEILSYADSFSVLLWAAFFASASAIVLVLLQRLMRLNQAIEYWIEGTQDIMGAILALIHAWAIGAICVDLQSAKWLVSLIGDSLPHSVFPAIVFALSCVISFSTGSSWGTMAMGFPVAIPIAFALEPSDPSFLHLTIGASFSGAIFGDHCSPISDTTILASTTCGCDLMSHVETQLFYSIPVAFISLFAGYLLTGFGVPFFLSHLACIIIGLGFILIFGKKYSQ